MVVYLSVNSNCTLSEAGLKGLTTYYVFRPKPSHPRATNVNNVVSIDRVLESCTKSTLICSLAKIPRDGTY